MISELNSLSAAHSVAQSPLESEHDTIEIMLQKLQDEKMKELRLRAEKERIRHAIAQLTSVSKLS